MRDICVYTLQKLDSQVLVNFVIRAIYVYTVFSGYLGADCKNLGLGTPPAPPETSSGSPINGTKEHEADTKGPII